MEADDDFGDLYSDVLLPVKPPSPPPPNPNSNPIRSPPAAAVSAPSGGRRTDEEDDWLLGGGGAPPTVDPTTNWAVDDHELKTNVDINENPRVSVSVSSPDRKIPGGESTAVIPGAADEVTAIPGLDAGVGPAGNDDDWEDDSDSEDDLKIVLNDTEHGPMDEMMYGEEEGDEEEDLVIVTNDDQVGDLNQDWGEEGGLGPAGEEGKEGEKGAGAGTAGAPGPARAGYGTFHPHHSTYKYVRPGAPGGGPGAQGQQVRPPLPAGPYPGGRAGGRGGDWRPAGGFRGGFGNNVWGNQNRPVGLDFSLPPQKTIFDFDIDSFEEKPWKHPGADLSDFFNFGMDEEKWKDYCKRLSQLKIESTMQSRIRVYESGRSEPEFDPDLPPELAAATGQTEMISEGGAHNMRSNGQADFNNNNNNINSQGNSAARPQLPTGRAILVESSYQERLPSMDTRPPRLRESDTIIEIVLQDSFGGDYENGDVADKKEREDSQEDNENDDFAPEGYRHRERSPRRESSHRRRYSPSSNSSSSSEDSYKSSSKQKEDSYKSSPKQKQKEKEKEKEKEKGKEEATQAAAQDPATQDLSNDDQSEQLVYSEPEVEEVNSVDQDQEESQSQSQSQGQSQREYSVREREESRQRVATRRSRSRSDDVAPHDRLLLPKSNRPLRKDHMRVNNFSNSHHNYNNNNNFKWRGNEDMKWRGGNGDDVYYHQQHQHHNQHYVHREREFVPHHHHNQQHGFRGRSFENNNRFNNRGGFIREEEEEMRIDNRFNRKGLRGVYEREDVENFRVRKREKDELIVDSHVKRRRDEEIYNPRRERGKVVEREDAVMMMERKRDREREREREERESSGHGIRVSKDNKRYREREERERLKSKQQIHEREDLRAVSARSNNRNGSTSRDEAKMEERERERKLRDKLLLNNNNNTNNNNNNNSRHDKDKYRDRRSSRTDPSTNKRKHEDHKAGGEQEGLKKILEPSNSDEDQDSDSRRGRSKLERWTSHKERDWTSPVNLSEPKQLEVSSANANGEDVVERLKRRSERFKQPLHGEKEKEREEGGGGGGGGGGEGELTGQSQSQSQLEVKMERPARKRRWTGS